MVKKKKVKKRVVKKVLPEVEMTNAPQGYGEDFDPNNSKGKNVIADDNLISER